MHTAKHRRFVLAGCLSICFLSFFLLRCQCDTVAPSESSQEVCVKGTQGPIPYDGGEPDLIIRYCTVDFDQNCCSCALPRRILCSRGKVFVEQASGRRCGDPGCSVSFEHTCKKGCRVDCHPPLFYGQYLPRDACEENRPKQVGDPCKTQEDCLPLTSTFNPADRTVHNTYLRCDPAVGLCLETSPKTPPSDYLQPCGPALPSSLVGAFGYVTSPGCKSEFCLVVGHLYSRCIYQACTLPCEGDHDCPQGSVCTSIRNHSPGTPSGGYKHMCTPHRSFTDSNGMGGVDYSSVMNLLHCVR